MEVLHEKMGVDVSWSAWRALNARDLASVREKLDAEAFEAAWAEGGAMTLEEVVAGALAESIYFRTSARGPSRSPSSE